MNVYDPYVMLALRFGWTPEQIDRLDCDYYDNLTAALAAEALNKRREEREARLLGGVG